MSSLKETGILVGLKTIRTITDMMIDGIENDKAVYPVEDGEDDDILVDINEIDELDDSDELDLIEPIEGTLQQISSPDWDELPRKRSSRANKEKEYIKALAEMNGLKVVDE